MKCKETCYMCNAEATSKEHVPPKSLFPKDSELGKGVTMRKNLIKVPSCDTRNSSKSIDDEYIMLIMSCAFYGNEFKSALFERRALKAFKRKPHILDTIFKNPKKVFLDDGKSDKLEDSMSFEVDLDRVDSIFHHMACGIYYHHFKEKWLGSSKNTINFLSYLGTPNDVELNKNHFELNEKTRDLFYNLAPYGDNREVFSYRISKKDNGESVIFLEFYEQLRVAVIFLA